MPRPNQSDTHPYELRLPPKRQSKSGNALHWWQAQQVLKSCSK
ncbi:hypothetical protein HMPREF0972_00840 [Actinomyces sp. oral taxon 848 str. F0332]|nr:hypothetical protein HMPREF0972_00840 [Actinomyces sp. oral taxon 848 str. F0332]